MASPFTVYPSTPSSMLKTPRVKTHFSFSNKKTTFHHTSKKPFVSNSILTTEKTDPNIPQTVHRFWQWLKDEGVVSAKTPVKPGVVPEGLGLVATRDIGKNEVVLEVPKKFWINPDAVATSEIGNVCSGLKPWIAVALFLLKERFKGEGSKWNYYFDVLPEGTNSTIYWSEEELLEIQGTQLLSTTLSVKEYVQTEFLKVEEEIILPNKQLFPFPITLDDFFWAFGILRSRAFSRLRKQNLVIIPFADLINHSTKVTSEDHAHEVYIQYDLNKSNADMALDYGFTESNSDRDAFTLTLEISESDEFYADKLDIAEENGFSETAYFDIKYGQPLPTGMLLYLRLVALGGSDAFLLESIFRNQIWGFLELPISREKRVLQQIDDVFKDRETELDFLEYYQERRLKDLGLVGEQGDIIFWEPK
ncbi:ribulose-1 5 bisphosphate carboxylase/oxygenase large subunit n-methyltransferase chloroplastic [Phtheirospermum japonicum]|uniref:Ribulose-1 5 bisphosphate carboxylase/oxygenase large subunit n-methyltransferase chloroplastic n=1 Tax=Phtheirospermum japonicum TaxID=374723 RepID=A0A830CRS2_9LAMI|nr:ribulose-1 5 bisphosphate carboxylase/oxygenase large subunit n-methyltransferase chloroplastic [Phtheirospermum japonicum]